MTKKRIGILTGGGDCPGLNPAIRGAVYAAEALGWDCVGFLEGWKGLLDNKSLPLARQNVKEIITQGGTVLGSSRTDPYKKEGGTAAVLKTFQDHNLHALIAIGGEDTLGVAAKLYEDFGLNVIGVPKTMDNDLSFTDFTFGFDSAVTKSMEALESLRDTAKSHRRCMVLEVMGRHAGWVALYTAIASAADYYTVPERPLDIADLKEKIKAAYAKRNYALVVASEATQLPAIVVERVQIQDDFGHIVLQDRKIGETLSAMIEQETGIETRSAAIGHIQRGGAPTLFDRMLGTRTGAAAVRTASQGRFGVMMALQGNEITPVLLKDATGKLKTVPPEWLEFADELMY